MIVAVADNVAMEGYKSDLETEASLILHSLYKHGTTKKDLIELVEFATMSEDALHEKYTKVIKNKIKSYYS